LQPLECAQAGFPRRAMRLPVLAAGPVVEEHVGCFRGRIDDLQMAVLPANKDRVGEFLIGWLTQDKALELGA